MNKESLINYSKFYLPNGIKCILYKRNEIHSVSISVQVNVGSLDENIDNNGISHLIEHLPFDGTQKFQSWNEIDRFNNSISGSGNAYTSLGHTKYYGTFPAQYLEEALIYYSEIVLHPLHKDEDIKKEKDIILDEMKRYSDQVESKVYDNIRKNRFIGENTPFSFNVIGEENVISRFNQSQIKKHYEEYYIPENIEIYIVGNFDDNQIKKYLERYFYENIKKRNFEKQKERQFIKSIPEYSDFRINALQKKDLDQYYLTLSFPALEKIGTNIYKRMGVPFIEKTLASSQYQQSILWKRLREELGLVYGISAYDHDYYTRSMFIIQCSFNPEHLETILREIYDGVNKIKMKEVSDEIFKTRQKRLFDTQLMLLDEPSSVMDWIEEEEEELELNNFALTIEEYMENIKKYKFEEVIETSNKILNWDKVNIGIVSKDEPKEVESEVLNAWQKIAKS